MLKMKKLVVMVIGFGMVSASVASAAVTQPNGFSLALGEKSASQMNGRMLACGRPARMKSAEGALSATKSQGASQSVGSARSAR